MARWKRPNLNRGYRHFDDFLPSKNVNVLFRGQGRDTSVCPNCSSRDTRLTRVYGFALNGAEQKLEEHSCMACDNKWYVE